VLVCVALAWQLRLLYEDAGHSLEEELRVNGRLPLRQVRVVLRQVLTALAHCHCQGITHRNLKPKYVLLRRNGAEGVGHAGDLSGAAAGGGSSPAGRWLVKLSDFNSVRWLGVQCNGLDEPLYGAAHVAGACSPTVVTQPYRAPEILLGCTSYNTAIDMCASTAHTGHALAAAADVASSHVGVCHHCVAGGRAAASLQRCAQARSSSRATPTSGS
jgi:serine/threonine protein kinase